MSRDAVVNLGAFGALIADEKLGIRHPVPRAVTDKERLRHTYIVGAQGSGKTELLKVLIQHEVLQKRAVVVIDAHSDMCEQVLHWPEFNAERRAVYIAPRYFPDQTPTINPFQIPAGADNRTKEKIANRLSEVIGEICRGEGGSTLSVRMVNIAKVTVRVLLDMPGATLRTLSEFLSQDPPAHLVRAGRQHPVESIRAFFNEDWDNATYDASKSAMQVRLKNLLLHEDFKAMTCGRNTVPFYDLIEEGKVLLFSLGAAGTDNAVVIGKMLVSMIAAIGDVRKEMQREDRRPIHLFLDECQNFTGPATRTIITELRKYGVHVTLANQYLGQLDKDDQGTVLLAEVKMMGKTDHSPTLAAVMGYEGTGLRQGGFVVRWGAHPPFHLQTRSDLADDRHQMKPSQKIALKASMKRFYRPVEEIPQPTPENAPETPTIRISRAFD
ncbi:MAG: hypothetical protein BGO05_01735 [Rhizobiales bacterium 63-7]|jgi:GTPase SAR1 family protein|nr:type IV secretion system DNA-binding domain-containing protein [Hyphomicrobiales bacterium]OJU70399.1 MAG: hypothetical protein BGO05_01735 [Rhizobiales bacterium 63-7]